MGIDVLERKGRELEAYFLARSMGNGSKARELLWTHDLYDEAIEESLEKLASAEAELAAAPESLTLGSRLRDVGLDLAEVLILHREEPEATSLLEKIAKLLPFDPHSRERLAELASSQRRWDDAVRWYESAITAAEQGVVAPPYRGESSRFEPKLGHRPGLSSALWKDLLRSTRQSGRDGALAYRLSVLRIHLEQRRPGEARSELERLLSSSASLPSFFSSSMHRILDTCNLGTEKLSFLEVLRRSNPKDAALAIDYARLLIEVGRLDEARFLIRELAMGRASDTQLQRSIDQLRRSLESARE
jgi:tetratricopeptide (TPR) repeat protein